MKLPYPFFSGQRLLTDIRLRVPTGGTLADARKVAGEGNPYQALLVYVAGSVEALEDSQGQETEGRDQLKTVLRACPWGLAEWIAFQSMLLAGASDEVDIPFVCPRCDAHHYREDDPIKISSLKIQSLGEVPEISVAFASPVEFKDARTGDVVETVSSMKFRLPSIGDCIRAAGIAGVSNDTRLQYAAWAEAIIAVNGTDIDQAWRAAYGSQSFERMSMPDVRLVAKAMAEWSIDNTVEAYCPSCGKQYRQVIPTGSFFASALRGD